MPGSRVSVGGFTTDTWESTGISYSLDLDSDASPEQLVQLIEVVDKVAEIPRAIRAGAAVKRVA